MIYEFITPSDTITFIAPNDKIAIAASLILGEGKAGCTDENDNSLPTMYLFHPDPMPLIEKDLGMPLNDFIEKEPMLLAECFESFSYGKIEDRKSYDDAMEAITDDEKRRQFKAKHEDRNRTSMSRWVKAAWSYAKVLREKSMANV